MEFIHTSVMPEEVLAYMNPAPGKVIVDGTLGGSGHAAALLKAILPGGLLVGIDQDMDAVETAKKRLSVFNNSVRIIHDNFENMPDILKAEGIDAVDGILVDLGLSFNQIEQSGRGFSFMKDEPLDMRMDADADLKAADIVNGFSEKELIRIFRDYGEEKKASAIARMIVKKRPVETTRELSDIICLVVPRIQKGKMMRIHPATKVFMALRIAVNKELRRVESLMEFAADLLKPGGRLVVISFHSLEDRIVKHGMKRLEKGCECPDEIPFCICGKKPRVRIITKKAVFATEAETENNNMARSARLRVMEAL